MTHPILPTIYTFIERILNDLGTNLGCCMVFFDKTTKQPKELICHDEQFIKYFRDANSNPGSSTGDASILVINGDEPVPDREEAGY